jgi:WD40 repeat protein
VTPRTNPYVGLVPYTEADAEWFFGRERERRIIAANLRSSRLTLLYGASGVGKSSVLRAGVVPDLRAVIDAHRAVAAPSQRDSIALAERPPFAVTVFGTWRDDPLGPLAAAIQDSVTNATGVALEVWDGEKPFTEALGEWTAHVHTLLVILDQFEEYFLYHPGDAGKGTFDDALPRLVNDTDLRVNFLMSLREDAWPQLDRFKGRIPALFDNYLRVDYLTREAARRAVLSPVQHYNLALPPGDPQVSVEPALVEEVLNDVRTGRLALTEGKAPRDTAPAAPASAADWVETPYLQLVMERLWETAMTQGRHELTLETLRGLGGAEQIVSTHLSDALEELSPDDQEVAAHVFAFLVTPSKTKIAHTASDLAHFAKHPESDVQRVLDTLATGRWRILRVVPSPLGEDAADRYEIFHDVLAEALLKWCEEHERVALAERVRVEEQARRKARRNRILRRLATILGLIVVVTGVAWPQFRPSTRESASVRANALAGRSQLALATDPQQSLQLAMQAVRASPTADARQALISALVASRARSILGSGSPQACATACPLTDPARADAHARQQTPAAKLLAMTRSGQVSFTRDGQAMVITDGRIKIWDPQSGKVERLAGVSDAARATPLGGTSVLIVTTSDRAEVAQRGSTAGPRVLASRAFSAVVSGDRKLVATARNSGEIDVYRASGGKALATLHTDVLSVAFSPIDDGLLAVGGRTLTLWRWRSNRRLPLGGTRRLGPFFTSVRFSRDGRLVSSVGLNGNVGVWDVRTHAVRYTTPGTGRDTRTYFSPDSRRLLTVSGRLITLQSALDGHPVSVFSGQTDGVNNVAFSPDGTLVATAHTDGTARIWDVRAGTELMTLRGHTDQVQDVAFSPNGRFVVTTSADGTARLWAVDTAAVLREPGDEVVAAALSPGGRHIAVFTDHAAVKTWTPATGRIRRLVGRIYAPTSIAISPRNDVVAVGLANDFNDEPSLVVVDLDRGQARRLTGGGATINDVAFNRDGTRLLTVGSAAPRLWDTGTWRSHRIGAFKFGGTTEGTSGMFIGDGARVLLAASDGRVRVVDSLTGKPGPSLSAGRPLASAITAVGGPRVSYRAAASPDDGRLVAVVGPSVARVWQPATHSSVRLTGYTGGITDVAFSPDGTKIVTGGIDHTTRVWDAQTGHILAIDAAHAGAVTHVAFSPVDPEILSVGVDGTAKLSACLPCLSLSTLERMARTAVVGG